MDNLSEDNARLRQGLAVVRGRRWTVLAITAACLAGAAAYASSVDRAYVASADVLVGSVGVQIDSSGDEMNMETERRVAASLEVASVAAETLGGNPVDLLEDVGVSNAPGTEILVFSFAADDPVEAQLGAQAFADAYLANREEQAIESLVAASDSLRTQINELSGQLAELDDGQGDEARTEANILAGEIAVLQSQLTRFTPPSDLEAGRVIAAAQLPTERSGSGLLATLTLALILGLGLGLAVAFLRDRLDETLRDKVDAEGTTGAPVLGTIPRLSRRRARTGGVVAQSHPRSAEADAYRLLRTRLTAALPSGDLGTILVTSALPGEGKSQTASNLAISFAQARKRVILVCADLRHPTIHEIFNVPQEPGLSMLLGDHPMVWRSIAAESRVDNLIVLPSGPLPSSPTELLDSSTMRELLGQLRAEADIVIVDAPPLLSVADAQALARQVDSVLLVADAKNTTRTDLAMAARELHQVDARLIGCVLNGFDTSSSQAPY